MRPTGQTLPELLVTLALLGVMAAFATPSVMAARDAARARSAADRLSSLLHLARFEAVKRHVNVALRFGTEASGNEYALYADGNGNGVRTADIDSGADPRIGPLERIEQECPGVRFAIDESVSSMDGEAVGTDPIRLGRSRMLSFTPIGTSSSGTVYLLGRGRRQFAVRVLGPTGRIRSLEYDFASASWQPR
jgi:prepilin-type N-terminal cleavage/methylation domain-containing protein